MLKESTHRADELKDLGWSSEDVNRYRELWDYRQRWGAINLERDDRLFLRKAESVLPKLITAKTSVKKPTQEKSYYRWLDFFSTQMADAEKLFDLPNLSKGAWQIILEEEKRILDYYEPVLGLPDTLKAKALDSTREELAKKVVELGKENYLTKRFDFEKPLVELKKNENSSWRPLRDSENSASENNYPVLLKNVIEDFRQIVRSTLIAQIPVLLPSLKDTEKSPPSDDWIHV